MLFKLSGQEMLLTAGWIVLLATCYLLLIKDYIMKTVVPSELVTPSHVDD